MTILKKYRDKIYEQDDFSNFVIQPGYKRGDLLDAIKIILNFNEVLSLDDDNYGWENSYNINTTQDFGENTYSENNWG